MPVNNSKAVRTLRKKDAKIRQEKRDRRSIQQQLSVLDRRLGTDQGARKERLRLMDQQFEIDKARAERQADKEEQADQPTTKKSKIRRYKPYPHA